MDAPGQSTKTSAGWQNALFECLLRERIQQVPYVPDDGHAEIIERAHADPGMLAYPLTTEEEGVAAVCGAWLGGQKAVLLMQSSGVGNCVNMFSLISNCRFPFLTIVTMRGEWGEFNPWQVPMGRAAGKAMELMGVSVRRVEEPDQVVPVVETALHDVFLSDQAVAVLLSQTLLGRKDWTQ